MCLLRDDDMWVKSPHKCLQICVQYTCGIFVTELSCRDHAWGLQNICFSNERYFPSRKSRSRGWKYQRCMLSMLSTSDIVNMYIVHCLQSYCAELCMKLADRWLQNVCLSNERYLFFSKPPIQGGAKNFKCSQCYQTRHHKDWVDHEWSLMKAEWKTFENYRFQVWKYYDFYSQMLVTANKTRKQTWQHH